MADNLTPYDLQSANSDERPWEDNRPIFYADHVVWPGLEQPDGE